MIISPFKLCPIFYWFIFAELFKDELQYLNYTYLQDHGCISFCDQCLYNMI